MKTQALRAFRRRFSYNNGSLLDHKTKEVEHGHTITGAVCNMTAKVYGFNAWHKRWNKVDAIRKRVDYYKASKLIKP